MTGSSQTCPHCGNEHPVDVRFCSSTGKKINKDSSTQTRTLPWVALLLLGSVFFALGVTKLSGTWPSWGSLQSLSLEQNATSPAAIGQQGNQETSSGMMETTIPEITGTKTEVESPGNTPVPPSSTPAPTQTPTLTPEPTLPPAFSWNHDIIQDAQSVGYYTSMQVDSLGNLHVGYFQDNFDIVWYADNVNGQWSFEYVVGGLGTGRHLSLDLDDTGNPHFAYHNDGNRESPEVKYVYWNGAQWVLLRLFDTNSANARVSLDLDQDNLPHIAFQDGLSWNVKLASFSPQNGWAIETVDTAMEGAFSFPLVLDAGGVPHLAYQGHGGGLFYATKRGDSWVREQVDEAVGAGRHAALDLDNQGRPHIAYFESETAALYYAFYDGESWLIQLVDNSARVGTYPDIVVDSLGHVFISYYDATNTALKFAHGRNGQWDLYTVDDTGDVGMWTSIVLRNGIPTISYLDDEKEDLRLAWASPLNP